jgi:DNA-binding response OmpR family regulator
VSRRTILVADDQDSIRLLVTASLDTDDYEVVEAADGDAAWEIIQSSPPDLAILDIQMPGRTGIELTQAIRASALLKRMPIILLSAKTQEGDVAAGLAAGADHYVTKPFLPSDLNNLIHQILH